MMTDKIFTPEVPVLAPLFQGRSKEIKGLQQSVMQIKNRGGLSTAFITGERGIGKSSFANHICDVTLRNEQIFCLYVSFSDLKSIEAMIEKILDEILKKTYNGPLWASVKGFFKSIDSISIPGITFNLRPKKEELERISHNFPYVLSDLFLRIKEEYEGIGLILDDIDSLSECPEFSPYIKGFVEEMTRAYKTTPLVLVLVGLPEVHDRLLDVQPSIGRIFDYIELNHLSKEESMIFFQKAFSLAGKRIETYFQSWLSDIAEGQPMFMHEIGKEICRIDSDGKIDHCDVMKGLVEVIKTFENKNLKRELLPFLRSKYGVNMVRRIIEVKGDQFFFNPFTKKTSVPFSKKEIEKYLEFINLLKKDGILIPPTPGQYDPPDDMDYGSPEGVVGFSNSLYYLYFKIRIMESQWVQEPYNVYPGIDKNDFTDAIEKE